MLKQRFARVRVHDDHVRLLRDVLAARGLGVTGERTRAARRLGTNRPSMALTSARGACSRRRSVEQAAAGAPGLVIER